MASSDFWQRFSSSVSSSSEWGEGVRGKSARGAWGTSKVWMVLDVLTIIGATILATLYAYHTGLAAGAKGFLNGTLIQGRSRGILLALLFGFIVAVVMISRRMHLYTPARLEGILHEQRLSIQSCLTAALLLTGTLYLVHADDIPRRIVIVTVALVTVSLSLRRMVYRLLLYRRFQQGVGTRNVLIVGTGPVAHALRHHLDSIGTLGYAFKGFIELPSMDGHLSAMTSDVVGSLDSLFDQARKLFVDEIFFTTPCERGMVKGVLESARSHGVDLRVVPDMYDGLTWNSPVEYIGQFPTIPLHCAEVPEIGLLLKRLTDIVLSSIGLLILAVPMLVIALLIKLDSGGPVLYCSERVGKKGRVFKCIKFRTMVQDAEKRRSEIMHMNERDGILFKISNDPRITRLGRFLRKYSLDELPQFFNVLVGEMSLVGPRPPIASEVREYKLNHLRRLDVMPGITGLWQVQARKDPSFDQYISLDMTYVENWSIWLDLKILVRTVGVVVSGTGS